MDKDLPHLDEIELVLDEDDRTALSRVRDVLQEAGLLDRFGVTLLHRHFDLAHGEHLVETTDVSARVQTIQVRTDEELHGISRIDTAWRLLPDGMEAMAECVVTCVGGSTDNCTSRQHVSTERVWLFDGRVLSHRRLLHLQSALIHDRGLFMALHGTTLPITLRTSLSADQARVRVFTCLTAKLLARGPRPSNMRGWGWSRISEATNAQQGSTCTVFEITRMVGIGSAEGTQLEIAAAPNSSGSGSVVTIDWGTGGRSGGLKIGVGSIVDKEVDLIRRQLAAIEG